MFNSPVHPLSRSLSRDSVRGNRYKRIGEGIKWEYVINPISMEKTVRAQSELARGMSEKPTMAARRIVLPSGS